MPALGPEAVLGVVCWLTHHNVYTEVHLLRPSVLRSSSVTDPLRQAELHKLRLQTLFKGVSDALPVLTGCMSCI